jgi:mRNA interferase MazF
VNRGEVWWADIPEAGRRPVLIITRQAAIPVLNRVVVVPATRTMRGIPTEVDLGPEHGMPTECALTFDNVVTVRKAYLTELICSLPAERMSFVCQAWKDAAEC